MDEKTAEHHWISNVASKAKLELSIHYGLVDAYQNGEKQPVPDLCEPCKLLTVADIFDGVDLRVKAELLRNPPPPTRKKFL